MIEKKFKMNVSMVSQAIRNKPKEEKKEIKKEK